MNESRVPIIIQAASACCFALTLSGAALPGALSWGFHGLAYLPQLAIPAYIILFAVAFWGVRRGSIDRLMIRGSQFMDRSPRLFFLAAVSLFLAAALCFRVRVSLLGDSFTLLYNFRDFARGASYLAPWHEPLSMWVIYPAVKALGSLEYPDVAWSFVIMEAISGVVFLAVIFLLVREIFHSPHARLTAFLLCGFMPYMIFFFGYIETYTPALLLLAIFTLVSIKILNRTLPFQVLPTVYVLTTLSHYVLGILGFTVCYCAYREYRESGLRRLVIGFGAAAVVGLAILAAVGFNADLIINSSPISHFLSLSSAVSPVNAYSQAYTMFSVFHLVDLANYLLLMCPLCGVVIIIGWVAERKHLVPEVPVRRWFAIALLPVGGLLFVSKLEQGLCSDWDVFAAAFLLVALAAVVVLSQKENAARVRAASALVVFTFLQSLLWMTLNSMPDPAVRRFEALSDHRIVSHLGDYTHTLRLFRYFNESGDTTGQVLVWMDYIERHPGDPRSYQNAIEVRKAYFPFDFTTTSGIYERWMSVDPDNDSLRKNYASFCNDAGTYYYREQTLDTAGIFFERSVGLDSNSAHALNNLGSVLAQRDELEEARKLFQRAIAKDSLYSDAAYNLGTVLIDEGEKAEGMAYIRHSAELGNTRAQEILGQKPAQ
jgi:tetratricopeptide (TPR) repeat protein